MERLGRARLSGQRQVRLVRVTGALRGHRSVSAARTFQWGTALLLTSTGFLVELLAEHWARAGRERAWTGPLDPSGQPRGLAEAPGDPHLAYNALRGAAIWPPIDGTACTGLPRDAHIRAAGPRHPPTPPVAALAADLPRSTRLLQGLRGAPTLHSSASTADEPLGTPLGADEQPWPSPRRP